MTVPSTLAARLRHLNGIALGAAVASRFFAVGAICIQVEGGVAAMATQALVNPMHVPPAWPRLRAREAPQAILDDLLRGDPGGDQRDERDSPVRR